MIKIRSKITRFGPTWILFTTRDRYFCIAVVAAERDKQGHCHALAVPMGGVIMEQR